MFYNKIIFSIIIYPIGIYSYTVDELKESEKFLKSIRWDVTPKAFIAPVHSEHKTEHGEAEIAIFKYMLYVDLLDNKPTVMIMKIRGGSSATAEALRMFRRICSKRPWVVMPNNVHQECTPDG